MAKPIAGQVVNQKMFIHLAPYAINGVVLFHSDMSDQDSYGGDPYICIGSIDVEFTIPEHDATKLQVEALNNHLQTLNAEHHLKTQNIKDQIQRLLAIGHDSPIMEDAHDDGIDTYVDEREDEDGRLDSWENHQSMVDACNDGSDK